MSSPIVIDVSKGVNPDDELWRDDPEFYAALVAQHENMQNFLSRVATQVISTRIINKGITYTMRMVLAETM